MKLAIIVVAATLTVTEAVAQPPSTQVDASRPTTRQRPARCSRPSERRT